MPLVTRTSLARPMAAYCLAHIFSYYHRLPQYSQLQREKEWKEVAASKTIFDVKTFFITGDPKNKNFNFREKTIKTRKIRLL